MPRPIETGGLGPPMPPIPNWLPGALKVGSVGVVVGTGALATVAYTYGNKGFDANGNEVAPINGGGVNTQSTATPSPTTTTVTPTPTPTPTGTSATGTSVPNINWNLLGGPGNYGISETVKDPDTTTPDTSTGVSTTGGGANTIGGDVNGVGGAPVSPITGQPRSAWSQALHDAMMNWVPGQSPHPLSPKAQMKYDPAQGAFVSIAPPPPEWNPYQNIMNGDPAGYPMPPFDENGMIPNMPVPQAPKMQGMPQMPQMPKMPNIPNNPAMDMAPVSPSNPAMPVVPAGQVAAPQQRPMELDALRNQIQQRVITPQTGAMPNVPWTGSPPYNPVNGAMTAGNYLDQLINKAPARS